MADFRRRSWITRRRPSITPRIIDEEITPSSGWTDYPDFHCLLVDLPGFEKDDIKFNVNESGIIVVSGRKRMGEEKQVHFEKTFDVPENGDVKGINTTFEGDTLRVVIPKVEKEKKDTPENINGASSSANEEENKEAIALPSNKDEEKKGKSESLNARSEARQESSVSPLDDNTKEKKNEEPKKFDSSNGTREEKKEDAKKPNSRNGIIREKKKEEKKPDSRNGIMEEKKEEGKRLDSRGDIMEEKKNITEGKERKEELGSQKEEIREKSRKEQNDGEQGKMNSSQKEEGSQRTIIVKIIENKGIFLASIISFTLGVLFSQKFHTQSPK